MPYSSDSGKQYIAQFIDKINPAQVLDIGAGSGTYTAYKKPNQHWTAIEIWEPNVDRFNLCQLYEKVIIGDARTIDFGVYDLVILGDVLEHMTKEEAKTLLNKCRRSKHVIVSIPLGHYPQDEYDGNPYEKHVVDNWSKEDFVSWFGQPSQSHIESEIGVFVYQRLKICVNAISKNEAQFVKRFYESAKDADLIILADTGSTDGTADLARECGITVYDISIIPWRFDLARNAALALVPADVDVIVSLDLDEVLEPGWREEIEKVWTPETTRLRYKFDWGQGICFYYEKIFAKKGYRFHHAIHEYPRAALEMLSTLLVS
jgi:hypothetical protein